MYSPEDDRISSQVLRAPDEATHELKTPLAGSNKCRSIKPKRPTKVALTTAACSRRARIRVSSAFQPLALVASDSRLSRAQLCIKAPSKTKMAAIQMAEETQALE